MSCKGLKASGDREDIENNIIITGTYDIMINVKDSTGKIKSKTFTLNVK